MLLSVKCASNMAADACEVVIDVPHVKQQHRWDCGLACSQMVLRLVTDSGVHFFVFMMYAVVNNEFYHTGCVR
jgi:Guanylylate cyclase